MCCFRLQRYKLLKAIHNRHWRGSARRNVVSDYKDTNFWKQFTTTPLALQFQLLLFQTTKIQTFESNSQRPRGLLPTHQRCFRLQRYKLLKAIHNRLRQRKHIVVVVSDYKDTNFWKQFTTKALPLIPFEALFQTTKIQTFESNSQPSSCLPSATICCFRLQRYKLLKAIHNVTLSSCVLCVLFQTTKIQTFESNSQRNPAENFAGEVVSDYKDTNFWKQFTTKPFSAPFSRLLFQTTKIQTFESNSQPFMVHYLFEKCCFRLQRYKLLKAIHNSAVMSPARISVVSDYKDTNFWKQFTTDPAEVTGIRQLFQTTKIQTFESNSQRPQPHIST